MLLLRGKNALVRHQIPSIVSEAAIPTQVYIAPRSPQKAFNTTQQHMQPSIQVFGYALANIRCSHLPPQTGFPTELLTREVATCTHAHNKALGMLHVQEHVEVLLLHMPTCIPWQGVAWLGDISNCPAITKHCIWYVVPTGTRVSENRTDGDLVHVLGQLSEMVHVWSVPIGISWLMTPPNLWNRFWWLCHSDVIKDMQLVCVVHRQCVRRFPPSHGFNVCKHPIFVPRHNNASSWTNTIGNRVATVS